MGPVFPVMTFKRMFKLTCWFIFLIKARLDLREWLEMQTFLTLSNASAVCARTHARTCVNNTHHHIPTQIYTVQYTSQEIFH